MLRFLKMRNIDKKRGLILRNGAVRIGVRISCEAAQKEQFCQKALKHEL